jgi:ribosomal protein L7/L12
MIIKVSNGSVVKVEMHEEEVEITATISEVSFKLVKQAVTLSRQSVSYADREGLTISHAKIALIKFVREILPYNLREAKAIVEAAQEELERERIKESNNF